MSTPLPWVRSHMQLLAGVEQDFRTRRPLAGLTIATAIHLEPKTAVLLLTLQAGGAKVIATGNLNSTQAATVDELRHHGIEIVGQQTQAQEEHEAALDQLLSHRPHLLLDNGGDLFVRYLQNPYAGLMGGTEETTSGRLRLAPLREKLALPLLVINDSPIKQFAENEHAVGQSVLESYLRITNRATNGQCVTVYGYGACGRGVAANFRAAHARVTVAERDPVRRLQAHIDGYRAARPEDALEGADVVITVTGGGQIIGGADLARLKDGAVLLNAGHFPVEIDLPGLLVHPQVQEVSRMEGITTLLLRDGRQVHVLGEGHMVNLAGPRPMGNSIESMDLGFTLQARCLEAVAAGRVGAEACVVPVPAEIDAAVADAYLDLKYPAL